MSISEIKSLARIGLSELFLRTRAFSLLRSFHSTPWKILTYHRVVDPESIPYPLQPGMFVRPKTFRLQMQFLKKEARVIPLKQLFQEIAGDERIPSNTVAIVFDDGWKDNHDQAFPILQDLGLPATICLATSYIGTNDLFWTDRISSAIVSLNRKPDYRSAIAARIESFDSWPNPLRAKLLEAVFGDPQDIALHNLLLEEIKSLERKQRERAVSDFLSLQEEYSEKNPTRYFLSWEEVRMMAEKGVSFITHSHKHLNMADLNKEELVEDLKQSLQSCRERQVSLDPGFCYPGGYFTSLTQSVLKELDFPFALGTSRQSERNSSPPVFGRIGVHEDVSKSESLFASRIWIRGF